MPMRTREPGGGAGRRHFCTSKPRRDTREPCRHATRSRREAIRSARRSAWAHAGTRAARHDLAMMKVIDSTDEPNNPPLPPRRPTRHDHDTRRHERAPRRHAASPAPEPAALAPLGLLPDAAPAPPSGRQAEDRYHPVNAPLDSAVASWHDMRPLILSTRARHAARSRTHPPAARTRQP